jgi:hypothetical protein
MDRCHPLFYASSAAVNRVSASSLSNPLSLDPSFHLLDALPEFVVGDASALVNLPI